MSFQCLTRRQEALLGVRLVTFTHYRLLSVFTKQCSLRNRATHFVSMTNMQNLFVNSHMLTPNITLVGLIIHVKLGFLHTCVCIYKRWCFHTLENVIEGTHTMVWVMNFIVVLRMKDGFGNQATQTDKHGI